MLHYFECEPLIQVFRSLKCELFVVRGIIFISLFFYTDGGYTDHNKFAFGAVMTVNSMNYYVAVSSFDKKQEANI